MRNPIDPKLAMPPNALLFVAPGCPHCATVLRGLNKLAAQQLIGKLTVLDVAEHPAQAELHGVRAAPWLRLGPFTLTGEHSFSELRQWAEWSRDDAGIAHYVEYLLMQGSYPQAKAFIDADTDRLKLLLSIVADPDANMHVRLGVSALLESHAGTPALQSLLPLLVELTHHADHRVRADACHLLGLTGSDAARAPLEASLDDEHEEVREIAADALAALAG